MRGLRRVAGCARNATAPDRQPCGRRCSDTGGEIESKSDGGVRDEHADSSKRAGVRQPATGVGRLVRRLERERRSWARRTRGRRRWPTEVAWRAGVAEGLRLAQAAIRKGV